MDDPQNKLLNHCTELGLSEKSIQGVFLVRDGVYQTSKNSTLKSGKARSIELDQLKDQARALAETLKNLDSRSVWNLQYRLGDEGFPGQLMNPDADVRVCYELWRPAMRDALEMLVQASENVQKKIPDLAFRDGRASILNLYAIHLSNLEHCLADETGFSLKRNGKFQKLSDAIFCDAGVPSTSEGAIKFLIKWRKKSDFKSSLLHDF